jgi:hypothetical protein
MNGQVSLFKRAIARGFTKLGYASSHLCTPVSQNLRTRVPTCVREFSIHVHRFGLVYASFCSCTWVHTFVHEFGLAYTGSYPGTQVRTGVHEFGLAYTSFHFCTRVRTWVHGLAFGYAGLDLRTPVGNLRTQVQTGVREFARGYRGWNRCTWVHTCVHQFLIRPRTLVHGSG